METYLIIDILIFITLLFEFFDKQTKKAVIICWGIFLTFFGGLRWETGGDWEQYYTYFKDANWSFHYIFTYTRPGYNGGYLEPLFALSNIIAKSIVEEYWFYNLLVGAFAQYTYYKFSIEFSPKRPIILYVLIVGIGVNSYMFIRSGFALVICYWAYKYVKERKLAKFLIVFSVAFFVHRQAIGLLPIYWLYNYNLKGKILLVLFVFCCLTSIALRDYINAIILGLNLSGDDYERLVTYTEETELLETGARVTSFASMFMYFMMLSIFVYFTKYISKDNRQWYECLIFIFFLTLCSNVIFTGESSTLGRVFVPYKPARLILIVMLFNTLIVQKQQMLRNFVVAFLLGLCLLNIQKDISDPYMKICYIPYKSVLD